MRRKKGHMERFNKKTGEWDKVPFSEANEEMIKIYDIMEAELEIAAKEEAMKLALRLGLIKKNN